MAVSTIPAFVSLSQFDAAISTERFDTRSAYSSDVVEGVNLNFLSSGHVELIAFGKMTILSIQGKSTKTTQDWMMLIATKYRPWQDFQFSYYLGNTLYRGYVSSGGFVYFSTLNTTDYINACIVLTAA